jgi:hypothetical protein
MSEVETFGIGICWSVYLDSDGPEGIDFGSVNTSVIIAKRATEASNVTTRFGGIRGIGRPMKVCCTGILKYEKKRL